jgi:hypothetical protein
MKILWLLLLFTLISFMEGCQPSEVEVTIIYDKNPESVYPYTSYGDYAKIFYRVGKKDFQYSIANHQTLKLKVESRTEMRALLQKFIIDASGTHSTPEESVYKVNSNKPVWKL